MHSLDDLANALARRAIESAIAQVSAAFDAVTVTTVRAKPRIRASAPKPKAKRPYRTDRSRADMRALRERICAILKADNDALTRTILESVGQDPNDHRNKHLVTACRRAVGIAPKVPFFKRRAIAAATPVVAIEQAA